MRTWIIYLRTRPCLFCRRVYDHMTWSQCMCCWSLWQIKHVAPTWGLKKIPIYTRIIIIVIIIPPLTMWQSRLSSMTSQLYFLKNKIIIKLFFLNYDRMDKFWKCILIDSRHHASSVIWLSCYRFFFITEMRVLSSSQGEMTAWTLEPCNIVLLKVKWEFEY